MKARIATAGVDHDLVLGELHDLAVAIRRDEVVADAAVRGQIERLLTCVDRMVRAHEVGPRGGCPQCGPRRDACPVHDELLVHYAAMWLGLS